jgi:circadian clock protein KaiC
MSPAHTVPKHRTGIPGFDLISEGGLPRARATLIAGTAGSAKTVFATHFLAAGITLDDEPGVFVTFEDRVEDIRANMLGFGWEIEKWEKDGKWVFIDAAPDPEEPTAVVGSFDLSALLSRIERAVKKVGAKRVSLDSLNALFVQYPNQPVLRAELFRITTTLKRLGVTVVFTGERIDEYGEVTRHGIEEFVADNVIILRNLLDNERRRRPRQ